MAGENDIIAKLIVEDQTRQGVESAKKTIDRGTADIEKNVRRTVRVFDAWNFSLNAVKAGVKALNFVARHNSDVQADWNEVLKLTAYIIEDIASEMIRMSGAAGSLGNAIESIARNNLQQELNRSNRALTNMRQETELTAEQWARLSLMLGGVIPDDPLRVASEAARSLRAELEKNNSVLMATQELSDLARIDPRRARVIIDAVVKAGEDSIKAIEKTRAEREKLAQEEAEKIKEINEQLAIASAEAWAGTFEGGFANAVKELEEEFLNAGRIAARFAKETHRTISDNLFNALKGEAVSFRDFMTSILDSILRQTTDAAAAAFLGVFAGSQDKSGSNQGGIIGAVISAFGGGPNTDESAMGNAYDQRGRVPFARGGIVHGPTLFEFAGGKGVMGEAGPEAIMPLERTQDGRLGVVADGAGSPIVVNISAIDGASVAALFARGDFQRALSQGIRRSRNTERN